MKFLCLHGMGTSSMIFEAELKKYTEVLGVGHEFVFINGFHESGPAAGLPESATPPYFCFYRKISCSEMQVTHDELKSIIEDEGPFDACIGFSQGAAVLTSYLMEHEIKRSTEKPPFAFAVMFSPTISVAPDQKFGQDYIERYAKYYDHNRDMTKKIKVKVTKSRAALLLPGQKSQLVAEFQDLIAQGMQSAAENGEVQEDTGMDINDVNTWPRVFHPFLCEERIRIPTVYVMGKEDPYEDQSKLSRRLCEPTVSRTVEHGGVHMVPRATKDVKKVVQAIEWAMHQSTVSAFQY
ncbi:serine hydrolase FSH [Cadophora sp. MPI-SDFR-AT-0126]|nr:serine hydrolase FSH [Leotiomycetes sp. MPI-SDFR-AT-0126]